MAKDRHGYLWIGTWDGISRFDGYTFKNYYHNPGDSTSIPYFIVTKTLVDKENKLWVYCAHSVATYDESNDRFYSQYKCNHRPVNDLYVWDMCLDTSGTIWISDLEGIKRFNSKTNEFQKAEFLPGNHPINEDLGGQQLFFDNIGTLWVFKATAIGDYWLVYKCRAVNGKINNALKLEVIRRVLLPKRAFDQGMINDYLLSSSMYTTGTGKTWFLSHSNLLQLDEKTDKFNLVEGLPPLVEFSGNKCFMWGRNKEGQFIYDPVTKDLTRIGPEVCEYNEALLIDGDQTVWISGANENGSGFGLTRYSKTPHFFRHYLTDTNRNGIGKAVFAIIKDKNNDLWIGARNNELYCIKPDGRSILYHPVSEKFAERAVSVRSFIADSSGLWIGFLYDVLARYEYDTRRFSIEMVNEKPETFNDLPHSFRTLIPLDKSRLIVGCHRGLFIYYLKTRQFVRIEKNLIPVYCFKADNSGNFWVGTNNAQIVCYDKQFSKVKEVTLMKQPFNVEDICIGDDGEIWIATMGAGICHYEPATGKKEFFTTANGLSNNVTYSILKDKRGYLWISTDKGINRFNPKTYQFRQYGREDGLLIEEFNADAAFQSTDGEMYFGGMGGVVSFYPDSLDSEVANDLSHPLVINNINVSGAPRFFNKSINDLESIRLNKGDNNFKATFSCIDFLNSEKLKYRYRLKGYSNDWTETDFRNRFVNYTSLLPGKYILEIEATDKNGNWKRQKSLKIEIPPYYYQTVWFKVLLIFVALVIVLSAILFNNRRIRIREKQKQDSLKLESLRGQMNPHFIFNSLNSINYFIAQNDRLSANRYIADFSRLIRSILNNLSQEYIPLEKELESLQDYLKLEFLRFGDKFDYVLDLDEKIDPVSIEVFPGMIQPFIENAIWHGVRGLENRKGMILVKFTCNGEHELNCIITDDGVGRKISAETKSKLPGRRSRGIEIITERLRIINRLRGTAYSFTVEDLYPDRSETGTNVVIQVPTKPKK